MERGAFWDNHKKSVLWMIDIAKLLAVNDPSYMITFCIVLITALITSARTTKEKLMTVEATRKGMESRQTQSIFSSLTKNNSIEVLQTLMRSVENLQIYGQNIWKMRKTGHFRSTDRTEEIKNRETSCEAVITNQSSISGGMAMANKEKKIEGRLGYNSENGRYGLLVSDLWEHTGFHCGECLEVKVDDKWVKTRMEMDIDRNWYLVDTPYTGDLEYVRARI